MAYAPPIRHGTTDDGVGIRYVAFGSGPPLVLIKGFGFAGLDVSTRSVAWMERYATLAETRTLIKFDYRGTGVSSAAADGFTGAGLDKAARLRG